jgi:MFS transporter, DHA1 family, multidrug resistance protein
VAPLVGVLGNDEWALALVMTVTIAIALLLLLSVRSPAEVTERATEKMLAEPA